jgi:hypothetical protein
MLRSQRSLNTDRFLGSGDPSRQSAEDAPNQIQLTNTKSTKFRSTYFILNRTAVCLHFISAIVIAIVYGTHFTRIPRGYVFVSPIAQLYWTNHALVRVNATENRCHDVETSPHFIATIPSSPAAGMHLYPTRTPYPNFMEHVFDFSDTTIIQYNIPGNELNLNMMMMCFCLLSFVFQTVHMMLLEKYDTMPRFLHYAEYAFSSPLMVMVMAVNVGLKELFVITSLGGLFFGMNILGMCAEVMAHYAGRIERDSLFSYMEVCKAIHVSGWVLFLFAMCPIWRQFHQVLQCSENKGTPATAYAAVILESLLFFLFGFLQIASLVDKFQYVYKTMGKEDENPTGNQDIHTIVKIDAEDLFKYDCIHALLSLTAKTLLAWLLLGPALSVNPDQLT